MPLLQDFDRVTTDSCLWFMRFINFRYTVYLKLSLLGLSGLKLFSLGLRSCDLMSGWWFCRNSRVDCGFFNPETMSLLEKLLISGLFLLLSLPLVVLLLEIGKELSPLLCIYDIFLRKALICIIKLWLLLRKHSISGI